MSKKILNYIKADLYRYVGNVSVKDFIKAYIKYEGFKFTVWLRACYFLRKNKLTKFTVFPISLIFYRHYKYKYGFDIPYSVEIGPGLLIFHIGGIVFSAQKAGKNLTLSHCTTVGMIIKDGQKQYPVIKDNVYIAPGAKVIGGINVGNNVAIGSNCVLNKSVIDNSIVVGIPGRVVSYNGSVEYINNPI